MPRFVPIVISVDDGSGKPKVDGMVNAFDRLDNAGTKAARGGMKNAFESTSLLRSEMTALLSRIPLVGSAFSGLSADLVRYAQESSAAGGSASAVASNVAVRFKNADAEIITVTGDVKKLHQAYTAFQTQLSKAAARGQTTFAGGNVEGSLRRPEEAFGRFVANLQDTKRAQDRTALTTDALGAANAKLVPTLEKATVGLQAEETAVVATGSSLTKILGPIALVVAAVVALTAGAFLGAKALVGLADSVSKNVVEIDNLATKTGFGLRTIQALSSEAKIADVSVGQLSSGLGAFDKNIEAVREGNKGLGIAFKSLNIDITSNETALRSAFKTLADIPVGYQRVAAAQRLFNEGGTEFLKIIDHTNGDIDEAIQHYDNLGTMLGGKAFRESKKFREQLNTLDLQFEAVKTTIALELMPVLIYMMERLSDWLSANRGQWETWGRGVVVLIGGIINTPQFQDLLKVLTYLGSLGAGTPPAKTGDTYQYDSTAEGQDPESLRLQAIAAKLPQRHLNLGLGTTGAKGSDPAAAAKRIAELQLKADLDNIKTEEEALDHSLKVRAVDYAFYATKIEVLEEQRHRTVLNALIQEAKAAEKLRDPNARRVAEMEIEGRRTEENNKHLQEGLQLGDKTLSQTRERIQLADTLFERAQTRPRRVDPFVDDFDVKKDQLDQLRHLEGEIGDIRQNNADEQLVNNRRLLLAGHEQSDILQEIAHVQDLIATGPYNESLRLQLAYEEAILGVQREREDALVRNIQNQVILAHQMDVDFNRLNDGVVDFLASQKTLQQTFQDVRTNSVRSFFDGIDSAIDKMTKHLGLAGSVLGTFLKDLAHLAASQVLRRLLGLGTGQGAQLGLGGGGGAGIGGSILSFLGGASSSGTGGSFNIGGGGISNPAQGSAAAIANIFSGSGLNFGGGITAPPSLSGQGGSLAQIAALAQGNVGNAAATGQFNLAALAKAAPFLGATLGAGLGVGLGGSSRFGQILGGVGGGVLGLGIGAAASLLAGGAPLAAILPLLGPAALIAAPLIIGAIILARNAQRKKDEKINNQAHLDTLPAVYEILWAAQRGELTVGQARAQWDQVHNQYLQSIAGIKDGKTKRNALLWWDRDVTAIWLQIEAAAKAGEKATLIRQHLVPEFGVGEMAGLVPYRGGTQTLIKVRPGERIDDVGLRASWIVPGTDYGRDSVYTLATPQSAVRTKQQQARIPGFAGGSNAPSLARGGDVVFEVGDEEAAALLRAVLGALKSRDGQKLIVRTVQQANL